jgi:hypothetical protein
VIFAQIIIGVRFPLKQIVRRAVERAAEPFDMRDLDIDRFIIQQITGNRAIKPAFDQKSERFIESAQS